MIADLDTSEFTDEEIMSLSDRIRDWADKAFQAHPPIRKGAVLDWCVELVNLRDEIDRVILFRAITK